APGPAPGRFWKIDVSKIDVDAFAAGSIEAHVDIPAKAAQRGVVACDLATAAQQHPREAAAEGTVVDWRTAKFAALNAAHRQDGLCLVLPQNVVVDEPIVVRYRLRGQAAFPYTLVVANEGAKATIVIRFEAGEDVELVSEVVEALAAERSSLECVVVQDLPESARIFSSRRGKVAGDAELRWAIAELGSGLSVADVRSILAAPGASTSIAGLFFPLGTQHVDLASEADHPSPQTRSETLFKSAAIGGGQARFIGNIRIHTAAHGADATLRDDALLLSKNSHIDSIPALEIAANDVKAYHGATIGALSEEEIFYAMSRGITRADAERMIALGFFEPAVARFPTEGLRYELHTKLAEKIV
ncbi:MAG: Fe-S cluster assembly protein SufD, partial [Vulcanimicrobiaceae bacterium]